MAATRRAASPCVETVPERFGHIDVLVNNAGITPTRLTVSEITRDVWQRIFSVNVEGPLRTAQCVAPGFKDMIANGTLMKRVAGRAVSGGMQK